MDERIPDDPPERIVGITTKREAAHQLISSKSLAGNFGKEAWGSA
jgi:hypothetical protein